jgi:hypothetical protein
MEPEGSLPHSQEKATLMSLPQKEIQSSALTVPNLYLPISLPTAVSEPALHRLLTFQVPNPMALFRCRGRTKGSVQVQGTCMFCNYARFYGEELLASRPTPKLKHHPLSAVRYCLFNVFSATLHIGGLSSIRNQRTRHAVMT